MLLSDQIDLKKNGKYQGETPIVLPVDMTYQDLQYINLMSSISHTYGNALAFIQNYIIKLFPENMFKTIHVNSKIAHRQVRSTPHEYIKKLKPMIVFRPRIPEHDEDRFLKGTELIERQTDVTRTRGFGALQPFFHDPDNALRIQYQLNRTVMYVDVVIVVSTLMQQLDYYHYLENAMRINHPFMLPTCLESYIPQEMLSVVSDYTGIPLYDEDKSTKTFLTYLNSHSIYPITFKLQGASKTREFYRYYPCNIDTLITDLSKDEGDKVGDVMSQYQISFTVRMEFNSTGFYYMIGKDLRNYKLPQIDCNRSDIIPLFTDVHCEEDFILDPGWSLYNRGTVRLEKEENDISFSEMLNTSIRETIKYHLNNGITVRDAIDIKIRRQGVCINEFEDYIIDWEHLRIHFKQPDNYHTFTIMVMINIEYINNLIKILYNIK